jgi:hypothetical protein
VTILIVWVPVEGRPQFHVDALTDQDAARLVDWLRSSPALLQLAYEALHLWEQLLDAAGDEPEAA